MSSTSPLINANLIPFIFTNFSVNFILIVFTNLVVYLIVFIDQWLPAKSHLNVLDITRIVNQAKLKHPSHAWLDIHCLPGLLYCLLYGLHRRINNANNKHRVWHLHLWAAANHSASLHNAPNTNHRANHLGVKWCTKHTRIDDDGAQHTSFYHSIS